MLSDASNIMMGTTFRRCDGGQNERMKQAKVAAKRETNERIYCSMMMIASDGDDFSSRR